MTAVVYRLRSTLRSHWRSTVVLTLLVAVVCGVVLAFAAGARRTLTTPDRYTASVGGDFDAIVTQQQQPVVRPRTAEVAALPAVASVEPATFVFGALTENAPTNESNPLDAYVFTGSYLSFGMRLISGRAPDPSRAGEFVATPNFVARAESRIGDHFTLLTITQEEADTSGFSADLQSGAKLDAVLVGIVNGPALLDDPTPNTIFSPALLDDNDLGTALTLISVDLRPGSTTADLRKQLDSLAEGQTFSIDSGRLISAEVRRAVDGQGQGLWLLAVVAGIASIAALGQIISRQVRAVDSERDRLAAIGFDTRQIVAESLGSAIVPIVLGAILAGCLAVIPSSRFPSGFVRTVEPHPGHSLDLTVLGLGALIFATSLMAWTAAAVVLSRRRARVVRPTPIIEAIATKTTSSAAAVGLRFAFTRRSRERNSTSTALLGVVAIVAGLVGAIVFGTSLDRLVGSPHRYGNSYDYEIGDNGAQALPDGLVGQLDDNPDVSAIALYADDNARIGNRTISLLGFQLVRGGQPIAVTSGRLPTSEDEIAFGRLSARDVGVHVGSTVTMSSGGSARTLRVTGIVVVPGLGANEGIGAGAVITMPGLQRLDPDAAFTAVAIEVRSHDQGAVDRLSKIVGASPGDGVVSGPYVPSAIVTARRVQSIPYVLAGLLGALAVLTVVHVMLTSLRRRRREFAVLSALGADRRWLTRAVHWQATLFTITPLLVGIPIGIILGRAVFLVFADSMGALDDAATPFAVIAAILLGLLILANVVAELPAWGARRISPAAALQSG